MNRVSNKEQKLAIHEAERLPALLSILYSFQAGQRKRIGKYPYRNLEAHAVFSHVDRRFGGIPLKSRQHT